MGWQIKSVLTMLGVVLCCALSVNNIHAQTIINYLQSQTSASDGVIRIECDPAIIALIGKPQGEANGSLNATERLGFRIQVFMGNSSNAQSRPEANSRQAAIQNTFPELSTYLRYDAPNWRLLVGDFITREEANLFRQRIQKEFPQFGKETYVVTDRIKLLIDR